MQKLGANRPNSIQNQKNHNTRGFIQHPENAMHTGRPRFLIKDTIKKLDEIGVTETSAVEIKAVYLRLINLTLIELEEISEDPSQSSLVQIVAKNLLSGKGFEVIQTMLDRAIGKSEANVRVESNVIQVYVPEDSQFEIEDGKNRQISEGSTMGKVE